MSVVMLPSIFGFPEEFEVDCFGAAVFFGFTAGFLVVFTVSCLTGTAVLRTESEAEFSFFFPDASEERFPVADVFFSDARFTAFAGFAVFAGFTIFAGFAV